MSSPSPSLTLLTTLHGHSDRVWCCAFSPNGRALATCGGDKQIRIWRQDEESQAEADQSGTDEKDEKNATTSASAPKWTCKQVLDGVSIKPAEYWNPLKFWWGSDSCAFLCLPVCVCLPQFLLSLLSRLDVPLLIALDSHAYYSFPFLVAEW